MLGRQGARGAQGPTLKGVTVQQPLSPGPLTGPRDTSPQDERGKGWAPASTSTPWVTPMARLSTGAGLGLLSVSALPWASHPHSGEPPGGGGLSRAAGPLASDDQSKALATRRTGEAARVRSQVLPSFPCLAVTRPPGGQARRVRTHVGVKQGNTGRTPTGAHPPTRPSRVACPGIPSGLEGIPALAAAPLPQADCFGESLLLNLQQPQQS